ncbi:hypothetical protein Dimus_009661 [Dionaea muscipula]
MGNCIDIASRKMSLEGDNGEDVHYQQSTTGGAREEYFTMSMSMSMSSGLEMDANKRKRSMRFKLREEDAEKGERLCSGSRGAVRIRVMVTPEQLQEILSYKKSSSSNYTSVEQLLHSLSMGRRKITRVSVARRSTPGTSGGWIPALESIPEDPHSSNSHA